MSKPTVYLSGPMYGCTDQEMRGWREEAKLLLGLEHILDPCDREMPPDEGALDYSECSELVRLDLADIDRSSAIIYNAWRSSFGSPMEAYHAITQRKFVVVVRTGPVPAWLRFVADRLVGSVSEACLVVAAELNLDAPVRRRVPVT